MRATLARWMSTVSVHAPGLAGRARLGGCLLTAAWRLFSPRLEDSIMALAAAHELRLKQAADSDAASASTAAAAASASKHKAIEETTPADDASDVDMEEDDDLRQALRESKEEAARLLPPADKQTEEEQLQRALEASLQEAPAQPTPMASEADPPSSAGAACSNGVTFKSKATPRQSTSPAAARGATGASAVRHTYKLLSVILHRGETASSGHYVSQILEKEVQPKPASSVNTLNFTQSTDGKSKPSLLLKGTVGSPSASPGSTARESKLVWKEYDDAYVSKLSDDTAKKHAEKEGYLFFYAYQPNLEEPKAKPPTDAASRK